jgi:hypothetical protein
MGAGSEEIERAAGKSGLVTGSLSGGKSSQSQFYGKAPDNCVSTFTEHKRLAVSGVVLDLY